jgi:hypothetical protein
MTVGHSSENPTRLRAKKFRLTRQNRRSRAREAAENWVLPLADSSRIIDEHQAALVAEIAGADARRDANDRKTPVRSRAIQ